jgi:hypothetical protein
MNCVLRSSGWSSRRAAGQREPHSRRASRSSCVACWRWPSRARAAPSAPQKSKGPDFSGVWTLNLAKSDFGGQPVPRNDTSTIVRSGAVYQLNQTGDFGPQRGGVQRMTYKWPATDGELTNQLPQGGKLSVKVTMKGDTSLFTSEFSMEGQTILKQTGRDYLSAGGTVLIRETDLKQLQGGDGEPIHMVLVYSKR